MPVRKLSVVLALFLASCLTALGAQAHHAFASSFDVNKPINLHGIVTKVELINPHSWIYIDVTDENGITQSWRIEGGSPNALYRKGITKASVPLGSELHVVGYQARDGSLRAVGRDLTFSDGRPVFFGGTEVPEGQQ